MGFVSHHIHNTFNNYMYSPIHVCKGPGCLCRSAFSKFSMALFPTRRQASANTSLYVPLSLKQTKNFLMNTDHKLKICARHNRPAGCGWGKNAMLSVSIACLQPTHQNTVSVTEQARKIQSHCSVTTVI